MGHEHKCDGLIPVNGMLMESWNPWDMNTNVMVLYRLMGSLGHEHKCDGLIPVNGIFGT